MRRVLTAAGLSEAVTFGFIEARPARAIRRARRISASRVANPLSAKFDVLRPSLAAGPGRRGRAQPPARPPRRAAVRNRRAVRGQGETRASAWPGPDRPPRHWSGGGAPVDFFDVKGVVERLCRALGVAVRFEPHARAVSGRRAGGGGRARRPRQARVGVVGQVAPASPTRAGAAPGRGLRGGARPRPAGRARTASTDATRPLPRYPSVVRDLSIVVADALPAEIIRGTIQAAGTAAGAARLDRPSSIGTRARACRKAP